MKNFEFWLKFHWKFVPKGPIDNNQALVYLFGAKPLSEPMLTRFTDAYMRYQD